jgi:hypothetical protein
MKIIVREKQITIREAEVEADSLEDAIRIATNTKKHHILFPEEADTYLETEFDAYVKGAERRPATRVKGCAGDWAWTIERDEHGDAALVESRSLDGRV